MHVAGVATALLLAAHTGLQVPTDGSAAAALARAEARWQSQGPKNYTFSVLLTCHCVLKGGSFRVVDGQAQPPVGANAASRQLHDVYGTVEKLFALIRRTIGTDGHRVKVKYDAEFGYPIWADLDPRPGVIDDELFIRVTGFRKR